MDCERIAHPEIHEIVVYPSIKDVAVIVASEIIQEVQADPFTTITYATGDTMIPIYSLLTDAVKTGMVDFSNTTAFHLDEYYPYSASGQFSFRKFLKDRIFDPLKIKLDNIHTLDGTSTTPDIVTEQYEESLKGIVRTTLLGVGPGGHIGFNEKGTPFESRTHLAVLSEETVRRDQVERGQDTPDKALTQGIITIGESERMIVVAYGNYKGRLLREALFGKTCIDCPASALRLFGHKVSIYVDTKAGEQIKLGLQS